MTTFLDSQVLNDAANLVAIPGRWTQGKYQNGDQVCAHGAVLAQHCTPGDERLWHYVLINMGLDEQWNDQNGQTAENVATGLREAAQNVTVEQMVNTFGPNWEAVRDFVRRLATLTSGEAAALDALLRTDDADEVWDDRHVAVSEAAGEFALVRQVDSAVGAAARFVSYEWFNSVEVAAGALVVAGTASDDGLLLTPAVFDAILEPFVNTGMIDADRAHIPLPDR